MITLSHTYEYVDEEEIQDINVKTMPDFGPIHAMGSFPVHAEA